MRTTPDDVEIMRGRGMLKDGRLLVDMAEEVRSTFNGLAASDALIRTKPELVQKFVKASLKGMIYARSLREPSIARFARFMKTAPDAVAAEYDQLRDLMAPNSTITPDAQATEIALRGEMMNVPAGICTPPISTASVVMRLPNWFELSYRKNSSIPVLISAGFSISRVFC